MKFRVKMTLCMLCLLAVLFDIGGTVLITAAFQNTLERENEAARDVYRTVLNAFRVANDFSMQPGSRDVSAILEQLSQGGDADWASVRLSLDEETIYESGPQAGRFREFEEALDDTHCLVGGMPESAGGHFLQVSGVLTASGKEMRLDITYDCSAAYEMRGQQQRSYQIIFLALLAACALLVYTVSWVLTRPLHRLTETAREIAGGDLSCRVGLVSNDELGLLSAQFDEMAERVERNVEDLQEAMRRKERFMGNFTHELKTPMTSIIGYADLLRRDVLDEEERAGAANYIFSEGRRLERMSLKMLDILTAGKREVELAAASPARLVEDLAGHLRSAYRKSGIELSWRCEEGECLLEPDLVRSLLTNLLDNARKAMDGGGRITVASVMTERGCEITVSDTGRGIPAEALDHLTEAFYRVDKSRARALGGAGLGLSWCAEIAELHHGTLRFESEPGRGTSVTAVLNGGRP